MLGGVTVGVLRGGSQLNIECSTMAIINLSQTLD